jgi:hypothetical protein
VRLAKEWTKAKAVFDEDNLVSHAGLGPVMGLAEAAGLSTLGLRSRFFRESG